MYVSAISFDMPLDGEFCINSVDIQQEPNNRFGRERLAIIPHLSFGCNGRVTSIRARVNRSLANTDLIFLYFQVWRPLSSSSLVYNKIDEFQFQSNDQVNKGIVNISLTSNAMEFHSGDVIGYYQPSQTHYIVTDINTEGYVLYRFDISPPPNSVDLSEATRTFNSRQPLLQFTIGMILQYNYLLLLFKGDYIFYCMQIFDVIIYHCRLMET